ncbi:MAG: DUF1015 domain-containing protein [Deltaproteobacteria bacterium]|nr:DUF1015 domain-containing protein [Deltaproteobacteria bacterium]
MAQIAPFRGLRYNAEKIRDLNEVFIPPYDVISPEEQDLFHQTSPYNMVHLELGKAAPQDTAEENPHTRAARYLNTWQTERVLVREEIPCIYYYELEYSMSPDLRRIRYGFICALRLEDFDSGRVRPHERTFQNVKDERLQLMLSCHANLSPIFSLFGDAGGSVDAVLRDAREEFPVINFQDRHGMNHRVWRVSEPSALRRAAHLMEEKTIFIADGHHRYETSLNYRSIRRDQAGRTPTDRSHEYVMMYLTNMNDEGLTILPTHRMLRNLNGIETDAFLESARRFFRVDRFEAEGEGERRWVEALRKGAAEQRNVVGFCRKGDRFLYAFQADRKAVSGCLARMGIPRVMHRLDVVVLDQVILRGILGLSDAFLADERNIHFKHDLKEALESLRGGLYQAAFFINPTRIDQVEEVAGSGLIMPHKSTYFYPKVGSGLTIRLLDGEDGCI